MFCYVDLVFSLLQILLQIHISPVLSDLNLKHLNWSHCQFHHVDCDISYLIQPSCLQTDSFLAIHGNDMHNAYIPCIMNFLMRLPQANRLLLCPVRAVPVVLMCVMGGVCTPMLLADTAIFFSPVELFAYFLWCPGVNQLHCHFCFCLPCLVITRGLVTDIGISLYVLKDQKDGTSAKWSQTAIEIILLLMVCHKVGVIKGLHCLFCTVGIGAVIWHGRIL